MKKETEALTIALPASRSTPQFSPQMWRQAHGVHCDLQAVMRQHSRPSRLDGHLKPTIFVAAYVIFVRIATGELLPVAVSLDGDVSLPFGSEALEADPVAIYIPDRIPRSCAEVIQDSFMKFVRPHSNTVARIARYENEHGEEVLNQSRLHGSVLEHLNDAVVVRFNVRGESEEREFLWKDLKTKPENLPVGTLVVGETRLLLAPSLATDDDANEDMRQIQREVEQELKGRGIDPQTIIGSEPDKALRQRSAKAWADDSQTNS